MPKRCSLEEAIAEVKSGDHIYLHHACSTPTDLLYALLDRIDRERGALRGLKISHAVLMADALPERYDPERLRSISLFIGTTARRLVSEGRADYLPVMLNDSSRLYDERALSVDVALMNLSPPDEHGYCSMGISVDMSSAAARNAKKIIGWPPLYQCG
jgi:acyl-CoA hydrolase